MKKIISLMTVLVLCLALTAFAVSCGETDEKNNSDNNDNNANNQQIAELPSIEELDLGEYLRLAEYKELDMGACEAESRGDAIWGRILDETEIIAFPEGWLEYYVEQEKMSYLYMAQRTGTSYEEVLSLLEVTEENIISNATENAKEDLVMAALIKLEGIELTEENINELFDTYVTRYTLIGYNESYIRENFRDEILDAMLRDKTIEFLIINNNFEE